MKKLFFYLFLSVSFVNAQSLQWADNIGGASNDACNEVKTDVSGNVYHVGNFLGTVDFDPGAGVANLVGGTVISGCVSKLSSTGTYIWAKAFLGTGASNIKGVAIDASGNVYVTGLFNGTVDFDPGAGTFTMSTTSSTDEDVFIVKLTSTGNFAWAKEIGGTGDDGGKSIVIDGTGNVIVVGECSSTIDLNPDSGVNNFVCNSSDIFFLKLDNLGNYIAAQGNGGSGVDLVSKLRVDASNNLYIGGYFWSGIFGLGTVNDCGYVAKISNTFSTIWARSFDAGVYTSVQDIQIDASGNVYSTGLFRGTTDFDPSAASFLLTSPSSTDYDVFVTKLNSTGGFVWADKIAGGIGNSSGMGISIDQVSNVFVIGYFAGVADFNPGAGIFNKYSVGSNDVFVCKLDVNGNFNNDAQTYGNAGSDIGTSIQAVGIGNYIIAANYSLTVDYNPATAITNLTSNGGLDMAVAKYNSCSVPPLTTALSPTLITICANTSTILSVNTNTGVTYNWYNTSAGGTSLGSGSTFTTPVISTTTSLWAEATNTCGTSARLEFSVNVSASPTVNVSASSPSVCPGSSVNLTASGASTYSWSTGGTGTSISVSPTITTVYTATGTSGIGCIDTQTISIGVASSPTVNITASSASVCPGSTATLTASGASTYTWSTGGIGASLSVTPTITSVYTATGTAASGCRDTQTITITLATNPTVNISASSTSVCPGSAALLTASGASTYTWNTGGTTTSISVTPSVTTVYTATGTAVTGCKNTQTISISIGTNPTVSLSASTASICSGSTTTLTASGASTYTWSTGGIGASVSVTPAITSVYTATGTAASGCRDTKTISINVVTTPTLSVNNYTICAGGTATLLASGASTYSWNTGATTSSILVMPSSNTNYTVTGVNGGSCSNTRTLSVTVGSAISIALTPSPSTICIGSSGTITASGATSYTWNTGSNAASIIITPTTATTYTVAGTSGSCSGTNTISISVSPNPTIAASSSSSLICLGNSATLSVTGANSYNWNPGSLTGASVVVSPTSNTTYTVVGSNGAGCTNSQTISLVVSACTGIYEVGTQNTSILIFPNPNNGDFTISVPEIGNYTIVNSIGQVVETIEVKENSQIISVTSLADGIYYVIGKSAKAKIVVNK